LRVLVNTFAVLAVLFFHFAAFNSFRAAITAIISTGAIVVFVVTVAIPFVVREFALPWAAVWVFALAFFAVFVIKFSAFDGSKTAVSAVVRAATVVIFVVTVAIPFVVRELTLPCTVFSAAAAAVAAASFGVQALASFAVFGLNSTALYGFLTTISAVILASTVVVFVVTIAIPFVVREFALAFAVTVAFILGVQTCAFLAIFGSD